MNQTGDVGESPWAVSPGEIAQRFSTDPHTGLSEAEAARRLGATGPNELRELAARGRLAVFLGQFADAMIALLAGAAVLSGFIGEWIDAGLIAAIVVANAVIGFLQEWRAEQAVAALKRLSRPVARVRRDGRVREIDRTELVPGDVIEFRGGDLISADARLVEAADLELDEAALTGESLPVEKHSEAAPRDAPLPERTSLVYSGTAVMRGRGVAIVIATGMSTEIGHIATLLQTATDTRTPLQERLARLSRQLAVLVIVIAALIFVAGVLRESLDDRSHRLVGEMLLISVSLAVAAIPEGLPAVITVALALGSQRMSRKRAIVRRLSAVETLGSVDVICSDKTGTLTQNHMSVAEIESIPDNESGDRLLLRYGMLCSDVQSSPAGGLIGSATETAIVQAGFDRGLDLTATRAAAPRLAEIPFSSARKRMSTLHRGEDGFVLITKGAAERVVDLCTLAGPLDRAEFLSEDMRRGWHARIDAMTARGRRVLAIAARVWNTDSLGAQPEQAECELTLLGIVAIVDPIRPEARAAIARCRDAGIRPIMITGDHQSTARTIADELALRDDGDGVLTGLEVDALTDDELRDRVPHVSVYARVSPEHKLRIVRAWQSLGRVVAMTGDGVNDAPALRQADIGVSMGVTGTDVARGASDMVLADDNFATIVSAVEEGRIVYENIRKFVAYLLTANTGEIALLLVCLLMGLPLPLLPVHILWVNLVTDGLPALALGFEPAERGIMNNRPRGRDAGIFSGGLVAMILGIGLLIGFTCVGLFRWTLGTLPADVMRLDYARTMAFFTISVSQLFFVLSIRSLSNSCFSRASFTNYRLWCGIALGIALQLTVIYLPAAAVVFRTVPLHTGDLALCVAVSTAGFFACEIAKQFGRVSRRAAPIGVGNPTT